MPYLEQDNVRLYFREVGQGISFLFQHGLGGDVDQPFALFRPPPGIRLISLDCRGHGRSSAGPKDQIRLGTFADDLLGLMEYLELSSAIVGGISMGAAVALNFMLRFPAKGIGLVLCRPAWLDSPNPFNVRMFSLIADLIRVHGPVEGLERFKASSEFAEVQASYPATAESLAGQFLSPRAEEASTNLDQIPKDSPNSSRDEWGSISVPTLVLANRQDPIHPFEYGETLAAVIPGAEFHEIPSKSVDASAHQQQAQLFLERYLTHHFLNVRT